MPVAMPISTADRTIAGPPCSAPASAVLVLTCIDVDAGEGTTLSLVRAGR